MTAEQIRQDKLKILMRAAKSPLSPLSAIETLRTNSIGHNSGNLIFAAASHALLSTSEAQVDTIGSFTERSLASRINSEYDGVVLPLANCFRPAFARELDRISAFIENLNLPFAMLSGGAQVEDGDPNFAKLKPMEQSTKRFCRAVLEKSDAITVRGEATASYINSLGFKDVEVIGCPSLTRMGPHFSLSTRPDRLGNAVAYNVETSKDLMGPLIHRLETTGADLTYIPQDIQTLDALVWARDTYPAERDPAQPIHLSHPHVRGKRVKFFLDASTWISTMGEFNLAVGPRIHGAISAISGGTPALLVTHDLRTRELADYHGIPHITARDLARISSVDDIWSRLDYGAFNHNRASQVQRVVDHLERNGFPTTLSNGRECDRARYFEKLSKIPFPSAVGSPNFDKHDERFAEARRKNIALTEHLRTLERRIAALERAISETK